MASAPVFKKRGAGKRDVRVRDVDSAGSQAGSLDRAITESNTVEERGEADSVVITKKRRTIGAGAVRNSMLQNGTLRKRSAGEEDSDGEGSEAVYHYGAGDGGGTSSAKRDATRSNTWYDEAEGEKATSSTTSNQDGLYHGSSGYSNYIAPHDDGKSSKAKTAKGPMRDSNVRTVTMFDYNPESCKSYKETGYCGFGDTCKFLHDRSDYLKGWQLDALPESGARQRGDLGTSTAATQKEEQLPFACLICRKPFTDPVVTKCGHYFCEACALKRYAKSSKCFACGKRTDGLFQRADKILKRMGQAKAARMEDEEDRNWAKRADADDEGEEQRSGQLLEGVEIGTG